MFLTVEDLKKHKACETGIKLFNKLYPNGIEIIKLLDNTHIPIEVLHWGYEHLNVSEEEIKKYYLRCGIINSKEIIHSERISNSNFVFHSKDIEDCAFVSNCNTAADSRQITFCSNVIRSKFCYESESLTDVLGVVSSKDIHNSINIIDSTLIRNCEDVSNSRNLTNCSFIYRSTLSEECHFSSFLTGCFNCLFCTDLKAEQYCLFNKSISKDNYNKIYEEFKIKIENEVFNLIKDNSNIKSTTYYIAKKENNYKEYFSLISDNFNEWVKSLPNFDPFIMYQITFDEKWLEV